MAFLSIIMDGFDHNLEKTLNKILNPVCHFIDRQKMEMPLCNVRYQNHKMAPTVLCCISITTKNQQNKSRFNANKVNCYK